MAAGDKAMAGKERERIRHRVMVTGTVQGVGFRPFVFSLAERYGLDGTVLNSAHGVAIDVEGDPSGFDAFMRDLTGRPPPLARITSCIAERLPLYGFSGFEILQSAPGDEKACIVPPDVAACPDCARDMANPEDRHYRYPFTNCTNCGPRFTITEEIPYDRPKTSMADFAMCPSCAREYHDPRDRRFHAQPVACPTCGPRVVVTDGSGLKVDDGKDWLDTCHRILRDGNILALKGIGGFHLACDALDPQAVSRLRSRKGRDAKPFAVMCRDIDIVERYCTADEVEKALLLSPEAPIVILPKKPGYPLPDGIAPGLGTLGVMLPYSPLHILLFSGPFHTLVMTSANYSDSPLVKDNDAALAELAGIADYFLLHDRKIVNRCDDSLVRVVEGEVRALRRSRGYVPHPVFVPSDGPTPAILGIGGEMKNNFCLLKGNEAFLSQYIGEISHVEGERNLFEGLANFEVLIGVEPEIVAYDMHPAYASSEVAKRVPASSHIPVQHHHAHLASCMAENGIGNVEVIGAILDGTGFGPDGHLWGFEILSGSYTDFTRRLHLAYAPLPGGEKAIREPWRGAYGMVATFLGDEGRRLGRIFFPDKDLATMDTMIASGFNSPLAGSAGRLFDAVSAILGICLASTYEGRAAIELGETVDGKGDISGYEPYPFEVTGETIVPGGILKGVAEDRLAGKPVEFISSRFHLTVARMVREGVLRVRAETGIDTVALSGGTWQNPVLFRTAARELEALGFQVLSHRMVPANDGGIGLGQALIAHWKAKTEAGNGAAPKEWRFRSCV